MKRIAFLIGLIAMVATVRATEPPVAMGDGPHIEFKYYGFYCVVDFTGMKSIPNQSGHYYDPNLNSIVSVTDNYFLSGITAIAGWQWRKETALGLGFSYLSDPSLAFSQIPVFVEFRSHFLRSRITPFTAVQLGYSIPFGSKSSEADYTLISEGGITFGFSAGLRLAITQKFGLNLFAGYQLIHLNGVQRGYNIVATTEMPELYNNIKFGLGINF